MKLNELQRGGRYYESRLKRDVELVTCHPDDGAYLIVELLEDDDLTGEIAYSESCYLCPQRGPWPWPKSPTTTTMEEVQ